MEGFSSQVPFLLLMLVIFVFFIILPQQRKVKTDFKFSERTLKSIDNELFLSGLGVSLPSTVFQ
jgi:preprotein translocase subunit YajC